MSASHSTSSDTKNLAGLAPAASAAAHEGREHPVLVVLDGRRTSRRYEIKRNEFIVGRDEGCDLVLHDSNCSRRHARFTFVNIHEQHSTPRIVLADLDSRNGTFVNGAKCSETELKSGDKILLGRTLVGFYLWDDATLRAEDTLLRSASTDALTGLYNRGFFQSTLTREFQRARRYQRDLSLVFFDLDHFKHVNDNYGHPVGDKVLIEVANLVLASSRGNDFACRYGGEEIMLILPETSLEAATAYSSRLREKIKALEVDVGVSTIHVTASFGVASLKPGMEHPDELIKLVDTTAYRAKKEGRDRVCFASYDTQELDVTQALPAMGDH